MKTLPDWMLPPNFIDLPECSKHKASVTRKAVGVFARMLTGMLQDEKIASRNGLLQKIDARFKLVGLIGLVVITTFIQDISALALLFLLSLAIAGASNVPHKRLLKVWLVVPLFSAVIVLPAILNIVTPGTTAIAITNKLTITWAGLYVAARFIVRIGGCVTLALLLTCTTKRDRLFHGLRAMGVPQIFVMLLAMMERYLEVLLKCAHEIHLAKISRSISRGTVRQEQNWTSAGIGMIFRKTYKLSDEIHLAMLSRGYKGYFSLLEQPKPLLRDWLFLVFATAVGFGLFLI